MKCITLCIFVSLCTIFFSCKEATHSTKEMPNSSMENAALKLEALCMNSQDSSVTFSMKTKSEDFICNYDYKYLGLLQVNSNRFEVLQKPVLSGQNKDALRASVSIRLFLNGKLYGEYNGLNNYYSIKVSSNTIRIYNSETKISNQFEIKDSIPQILFFPYNSKDSSSTGDLFYFNRY